MNFFKRFDFFGALILLMTVVVLFTLICIFRGDVPHSWTESEIREIVRSELANQK